MERCHFSFKMSRFLKLLISFVIILEVVNCHPSVELRRSRRQSESENKNSDDNKGSNPVEGFRNVIKDVSKAIRNLIAIKQQLAADALPVIQTVGDTVQNAYKSGLVQTSTKLVRTAADNANNVVITAVKAGEQTVPLVNSLSRTISEVSSPLIKIALCTLICPLQSDEEKLRCEKDNCTKKKDQQ